MKMKVNMKKLLCLLGFVLCFIGVPAVTGKASAANQLDVTAVSDLNRITGEIPYQNITLPLTTKCATYKFTVKMDGLVKIITSASELCVNYVDDQGRNIVHNLKVSTRVYRNAALVDQAGAEAVAYRNQNGDTGALFLTAGEYYVQFEAVDPAENDALLSGLLSGSVKAAVFYQTVADTKGTIEKLGLSTVKNINYGEDSISYKEIPLSNVTKSATAKITLTKPGCVKLITNASNVSQLAFENGTSKTVSTKIVTRVYQNPACTKQIGKEAVAVRNTFSETGVLYLEKGTYYIQYDAQEVSSDTAILGMIKVAALYQPYATNETVVFSSHKNANSLAWSKQQTGFLSQVSKTDFYKFTVKSYIPVKIACRTSEAGKTNLTLYNGNYTKVAQSSGTDAMEEIRIEKYVKPGTYYVQVNSSAKGAYVIRLAKQNDHLTLQYKMPVIKVKTVADYAEIRYLKGNHYDQSLVSKLWDNATVLKKGSTSFTVNQKGYYTVRVTNANGKYSMKTIYISKADSKKPAKPVFTQCRAGSCVIKGKAERSSTVYVKVNAYQKLYKVKASKNGTFRVSLDYYLFQGDRVTAYAIDKAGNKGASRMVKVK